MTGKREKPEDIVMKLRQVEVLQGQGMSVAEAVRQIGVTPVLSNTTTPKSPA
jgi:putative transposase